MAGRYYNHIKGHGPSIAQAGIRDFYPATRGRRARGHGARFVFKPKPELPFRPVGPSVGEVVRSTPLRAPGLVLAAHGVGWRALRVLPRLVFWPHCVY